MSAIWRIKSGGEKKALAAWGVRNLRRQLLNQNTDTLTFDQPLASLLDDPLFAEGSIVELYRRTGDSEEEETRWFYGRAEDAVRVGDARRPGLSYLISGPWWWLETMGFRQEWTFKDGAELTTMFTSALLLGTTLAGGMQSVGDQIAEAVNYAIAQGAPLALDSTGLPTYKTPVQEIWNESVANVIRRMLRWSPDTVAAFDYSTAPYPTLRFRRRSETVDASKPTRVTLPALDERLIPSLQLRARNDLKVPGVVIYYLQSSTVNGVVYAAPPAEDVFPEGTTGQEPKALVCAVSLEGANITYAEATIRAETISPTTKAWWKSKRSDLAEIDDADITIDAATVTRSSALPREFIGQYAGWMGGSVAQDEVTALISYTVRDGGSEVRKVNREKFSVKLLATDLVSGTYRSRPGGVAGEAQPIGLAEALYLATKETQYDGQLILKESACSARVGLGNLLNLSGGRAEWVGMNAQVQQITEEIDSGTTTIIIGPPKHLGPDDYMELLRATRWRVRVTPVNTRATAIGSHAGNAVLGEHLSKEVHATSKGGEIKKVFYNPSDPDAGRVTIDIDTLDGADASFLELTYSKLENGACVRKKRKFLCTPEENAA